jgi:hypothetical protein
MSLALQAFSTGVRWQTSSGYWSRPRRLCLRHVDRERCYELHCQRTRNWGFSIRVESHCTVFLDGENAVQISVLESCRSRLASIKLYRRGTISFRSVLCLAHFGVDTNSTMFQRVSIARPLIAQNTFEVVELLIENLGLETPCALSLVALVQLMQI